MAETKANKQNQKKDKKKKDPGVEAITAALKALPADQQVATLLSKYAELAEDNRRLQTSVKAVERQVQILQKEKDQMESDHTKAVLTKSRLESLCRELQRQNKIIKDENLSRLKEEEERRKEVSTKFNNTLSEISNLMKENSDKNSKLRDENQDMAGRLQELVKQYEEREAHVEKMMKQKDLQCQLLEAKLAKHQIEVTEDKEKMLLEKKALLEEIASYQHKAQQMSMTEISLRTQLNSYMEKYEEFQTMLDKSNKIFNTFKKEMDEMTKKIKKLEKETKTWKERWEGANKALLDMVTERSELEKRIDTQLRQNTQLQNLCRALQQQLTEMRNKEKKENLPELARQEHNLVKNEEGDQQDSSESVLLQPAVKNNDAGITEAPVELDCEDKTTSVEEPSLMDIQDKKEALKSDNEYSPVQIENTADNVLHEGSVLQQDDNVKALNEENLKSHSVETPAQTETDDAKDIMKVMDVDLKGNEEDEPVVTNYEEVD